MSYASEAIVKADQPNLGGRIPYWVHKTRHNGMFGFAS